MDEGVPIGGFRRDKRMQAVGLEKWIKVDKNWKRVYI